MWCHDPLPKDWTFCGAIQTTPLSTSSSSSLSHFFSSSLYISDWGRMAPGLLIWRQAQCTLYCAVCIVQPPPPPWYRYCSTGVTHSPGR